MEVVASVSQEEGGLPEKEVLSEADTTSPVHHETCIEAQDADVSLNELKYKAIVTHRPAVREPAETQQH